MEQLQPPPPHLWQSLLLQLQPELALHLALPLALSPLQLLAQLLPQPLAPRQRPTRQLGEQQLFLQGPDWPRGRWRHWPRKRPNMPRSPLRLQRAKRLQDVQPRLFLLWMLRLSRLSRLSTGMLRCWSSVPRRLLPISGE